MYAGLHSMWAERDRSRKRSRAGQKLNEWQQSSEQVWKKLEWEWWVAEQGTEREARVTRIGMRGSGKFPTPAPHTCSAEQWPPQSVNHQWYLKQNATRDWQILPSVTVNYWSDALVYLEASTMAKRWRVTKSAIQSITVVNAASSTGVDVMY